ncbi:TetR family transcriptional regulator [Streptomyces solincola]|uniref:TetR family transcriptional regulator n=1 Tax=Streptomyces solincola TaxID=2100817 RepID=A0A2S9PSQ5_9ACTN|nr:TetR family transcriptional regulator [Streptomyces solincola]PRH77431.1 TetR family transcriptional regulator [Streptomyces solincola]
MSHTAEVRAPGVRQAQKQRTRRALLDAALALLAEQSLGSLGLREVTRAAGVAPAAFYRHFRDIPDLGVALVDEALDSLHGTIRTALAATLPTAGRAAGPRGGGDRRIDAASDERIEAAVELIAALVREYPAHVRFIAREQHGGVAAVRAAITGQLALFAAEVADALAAAPESAGWRRADLLMLAGLYVDHMVMTASALLAAGPEEAGRVQVVRVARQRMRLISLGRRHWLD